ncbi:MAG TPA: zinc metalloprotease HtpX [Methanothrix sp.]|jgi:heat shock protein HtpX|uniref:zinc metalloprotease HtpX n=1 Tax=Methanothrix sp. TaxID=90426 RepID=UPI002C33E3FE|nr:zinc metalloprotease HtpX [Methanothrix sp.]MDI9416645.1 zinc metalloprotease HtpX [Euryarchaeota archaeon]HON36042.1 zinc metalloprotease HtpX [Methanothrix sp.]HRU75715.1 zinc metalloprotease HtpX [Methanothrix sp.]
MIRWKADRGLEARMLLTMFLLAILYLAFLAVLVSQGVSNMVIIIIMGGFMLLQYYYSDRMILTSMGARIVSESEAPELHQIVSRLCAIADLPMPKIAVVNSSMPNAFATGRNQKNAVVAVTTGIVQRLNHSELEAVLAHELTHVKNRDMMVMTIATFLSSIAQLLVRYLPFMGGGGGGRDRDSGGSFVVVFIVSLLVWVLSFILIQALSRYREFAADRGAAIITGQPSNLVSALMKISGFKVPTEDLRRVEGPVSALFIVPALTRSSLMNLFSTHPTLEARIEALQRIEQSGAI